MSEQSWEELEQKAPTFAKRLASERATQKALSSVGIPSSPDTISRWEGLSGEEILDAIDRGFPDAKSYRLNGSIKADYSEIELLTPRQTSFARTGISLKVAARLAELESPVRPILDWLHKGFSGSELVKWERAGFPAFIAIDWRTAGFTVTESTAWLDEGFTDPDLARGWLESGLDPKIAARRDAAGMCPPKPLEESESE